MNGEISEADAKTLIDEHLREQGWNLKDFSILRKEYTTPYGNSADYVFLKEGVPFAILEAKNRERIFMELYSKPRIMPRNLLSRFKTKRCPL